MVSMSVLLPKNVEYLIQPTAQSALLPTKQTSIGRLSHDLFLLFWTIVNRACAVFGRCISDLSFVYRL
jgi:hypothetical protein